MFSHAARATTSGAKPSTSATKSVGSSAVLRSSHYASVELCRSLLSPDVLSPASPLFTRAIPKDRCTAIFRAPRLRLPWLTPPQRQEQQEAMPRVSFPTTPTTLMTHSSPTAEASAAEHERRVSGRLYSRTSKKGQRGGHGAHLRRLGRPRRRLGGQGCLGRRRGGRPGFRRSWRRGTWRRRRRSRRRRPGRGAGRRRRRRGRRRERRGLRRRWTRPRQDLAECR